MHRGAVDIVVAANNSDNIPILVGSGLCIVSGIGVLTVAFETETYAHYANGMAIRLNFTP